MADTDGQRPEAIGALHPYLWLVQMTLDTPVVAATVERAMETVRSAAHSGDSDAVVIAGNDADYLQIVEQAHVASSNGFSLFIRVLRPDASSTDAGAC